MSNDWAGAKDYWANHKCTLACSHIRPENRPIPDQPKPVNCLCGGYGKKGPHIRTDIVCPVCDGNEPPRWTVPIPDQADSIASPAEILSLFAQNFASPPDDNHGWWGHDTDLGDQNEAFHEATLAIMDYCNKQVELGRIDPFDFVEPCEPDCTPERHAYHQGQWDMAGRINKHFGLLPHPGAELAPQPPMGKHTPTGTVYDAFPPTNKPHTGKEE